MGLLMLLLIVRRLLLLFCWRCCCLGMMCLMLSGFRCWWGVCRVGVSRFVSSVWWWFVRLSIVLIVRWFGLCVVVSRFICLCILLCW